MLNAIINMRIMLSNINNTLQHNLQTIQNGFGFGLLKNTIFCKLVLFRGTLGIGISFLKSIVLKFAEADLDVDTFSSVL